MKISKHLIIILTFVIFTMLSVVAKVNLGNLKTQIISGAEAQTGNLQAIITVRR